MIKTFIDFILHIDKYLIDLINLFGLWIYIILFLIIFCETGFVVTPFLPGDSLLFAAGTLAGIGSMNLYFLFIMFTTAAILGDSTNYFIGYKIGPKVFNQEKSIFFNKEYLNKAEKFYEKHGDKAIFLSRFVPIIRTFAPFVAGIGKMNYFKFLLYNVLGGLTWVSLFLFGGYFFGNIPFVKENFSFFIIGIIVISFIPIIIEIIKSK